MRNPCQQCQWNRVTTHVVELDCPHLIIVSSANYLLARRPQYESVFELSRITTLHIAQRGVTVDQSRLLKIAQCHQVFRLVGFIWKQVKTSNLQGTLAIKKLC